MGLLITPKYKVGDIVMLNSGGPPMTVIEISEGNVRDHYLCQWFNIWSPKGFNEFGLDGLPYKSYFREEVIKKIW